VLRYAWRELVRNPRRTLVSLVGVALGVGLFSGVLFFIDGSGASMTKRSLAPLALDMQRVLTSPLSGGLGLEERLSGPSALRAGHSARITLTVVNRGAQPARDVVVNDEPPAPLAYIHGTTTLHGNPLRDKGGQSPLAHGLARTGLNIGTVPAKSTTELTYDARATRPVGELGALKPRGTISSRADVVPAPANAAPQLTLGQLEARIAAVPGVGSADGLSFVDLPPGSLHAGGSSVDEPVRVFGFDRGYQQHYPSIQITAGSLGRGSAVLSAEASHTLSVPTGTPIGLSLPGTPKRLSLPISGIADLSTAKPLFYSRNSNKLEDFLYVPNAVIVSPATFEQRIMPAFQAASAARGGVLKSPPVQEVDVRVDRSLLQSDPGTALAQTKQIAHAINSIAPGQDYLIDNISNTLAVAKDDAAVGKRMFLFLGLPGVLLAALLAAYTNAILAATQRRERASLRVRGADRGHLLRILGYRTLLLAGVGSILGAVLGFGSVVAILGRTTLFEAAAGDIGVSAVVAIGVGMLTTALAMYIPARRALGREIGLERREMALEPTPAWRRWRVDVVLVAAATAASVIAFRTGAFDAPGGSVSTGEAVSLPSHLLLAPLLAWLGGTLLSARVFEASAAHLPVPAAPAFGPVIVGTLSRSLRRRPRSLVTGIVGVALTIAFGTALAMFAATYDAAKAADSEFAVGSDLRITPSVLSHHPLPPRFASRLRVAGVSAVAPVVSKPENSVLIGRFNQDLKDLTAVDPATFERVANLSDSFFVDRSAAGAMAALGADPKGVLVDTQTADDLSIRRGDTVKILLARGTSKQTLERFHVTGLFERFPGFPQGTNLVANLGYYDRATGTSRIDFFLARTTDGSHAGLGRATAALLSGPGKRNPIQIDSTETTLDKDQSSLTALNVNGLLDLDSLYTLLIGAACIGMFVFGLMLQRRREYVTLLAQGMQGRTVRALVMAEAGLVAGCGLAAGVVVGAAMGFLIVHVLRSLFILDPGVAFPVGRVAMLGLLAMAAALASALAASAYLRRLSPAEVLRET
jgi:putative ABC transport system permease protein